MEFTVERKRVLLEEMKELLREYDYSYTDEALLKILDTWFENKKGLIEILSKHPNWNPDKWHIAFDQDFERKIDANEICETLSYFRNLYYNEPNGKLLEKRIIDGKDYDEASKEYNKYLFAKRIFEHPDCIADETIVNGFKKDDWQNGFTEARRLYDSFDGSCFTPESEAKDRAFRRIIDHFMYYTKELLTSDAAYCIDRYFPELRVRDRQKTSRAVNKVLQHLGVDKWTDEDGTCQYNKMFARYSDAINTLQVKRHTIISVNPIDYLTMSFGNSWASCHTIDKKGKRNREGDGYSGCYSSGTMSYMLDGTSMVFYTVDSKYDGVDYELQDKINRNMFHFGEDKLVQGRVYPQSNDVEGGIYTVIREIMQKVMADCLGVPNMWDMKRGTDYIYPYVNSEGTHYRDYTSYGSCTLSKLKGSDNDKYFVVGHTPICVNTGEEHDYEDTIQPYN